MADLEKYAEPKDAEDLALAVLVGALVGFLLAWLDHFLGAKIGLTPA